MLHARQRAQIITSLVSENSGEWYEAHLAGVLPKSKQDFTRTDLPQFGFIYNRPKDFCENKIDSH